MRLTAVRSPVVRDPDPSNLTFRLWAGSQSGASRSASLAEPFRGEGFSQRRFSEL